MTRPDNRARGAERDRRVRYGEQPAAGGFESAAAEEQARTVPAVSPPPEGDRNEERQERVRRCDETDRSGPVAERQQAV